VLSIKILHFTPFLSDSRHNEGCVSYLRKIHVSLSKGYKFKLPEELILRPLRKYKRHIAEAKITGRWTHGELFERLYERAKTKLTST
jgi:hypothetical protein